jgi:hypothetical protein
MALTTYNKNNMTFTSFFKLKKVPIGIFPLLGVMSFAVCGGTYFAYHSLSGPEIQLRKNHKANMDIPVGVTTKLYNPNGKFEGKWSRQF